MLRIDLFKYFTMLMLKMKNIVLFTLIILTLSSSLTGTVLLVQQAWGRLEMREKLENANLVTLNNIRPENFTWTREGKEMLIQGQLFDVKNVLQNHDGSLTVKGLFDNGEDNILALIKDSFNSPESNGMAHKILANFFQQVLGLNDLSYVPLYLVTTTGKTTSFYLPSFLALYNGDILTPPPQA